MSSQNIRQKPSYYRFFWYHHSRHCLGHISFLLLFTFIFDVGTSAYFDHSRVKNILIFFKYYMISQNEAAMHFILLTVITHTATGHIVVSPVLNICTVLFLLSFFWNSKVIATMFASHNYSVPWFTVTHFFLNFILFILTILVLLFFSSLLVCKYSHHDLMAKNIAPINSQATALSLWVIATSITFLTADMDSAFSYYISSLYGCILECIFICYCMHRSHGCSCDSF